MVCLLVPLINVTLFCSVAVEKTELDLNRSTPQRAYQVGRSRSHRSLQEKLIFVLALFFFFFRETSFEYKCHIQRMFWGTIFFQTPHPPLSLKLVIEKLHRERSGLTTALCAFLVCKKAAHAGEINGEKTSQRAPPFSLWMVGV